VFVVVVRGTSSVDGERDSEGGRERSKKESTLGLVTKESVRRSWYWEVGTGKYIGCQAQTMPH